MNTTKPCNCIEVCRPWTLADDVECTQGEQADAWSREHWKLICVAISKRVKVKLLDMIPVTIGFHRRAQMKMSMEHLCTVRSMNARHKEEIGELTNAVNHVLRMSHKGQESDRYAAMERLRKVVELKDASGVNDERQ